MSWLSSSQVAEFAAAGTDSFRIGFGTDWRVERFGDGLIISHEDGELPQEILARARDWCVQNDILITRFYARRLVIGPDRSDVPRLIEGSNFLGHTAVAAEAGLKFSIDFLAGYSCGLFLDQRANRARLRQLAPGRVLNTFAYTCSFSAAAAAGGARTMSIDLARTALDRGKQNFALNDLSLSGHRFIADDVLAVLPRLGRRGEKFDAIILDPPTFSRDKAGRVFRVEKDFGRLVQLALNCAAPRAAILLSTNCSTLDPRSLRAMAAELAPEARFSLSVPLPDIPPAQSATTLWMMLP